MPIVTEFNQESRKVKVIFEKMIQSDGVLTLGISTPPALQPPGSPATGAPAPGTPAPGLPKTTQYVGWTINLPDSFMVPKIATQKGKLCKVKVKWTSLLQKEQIDYLRFEYIPKVVCGYTDKALCVFELTKKGNVHAHLLVTGIYNDYQLMEMQRSVAREHICVNIVGTNPNKQRHLNYIHWLTSLDDWLEYLQKDIEKHTYPILLFQ